MCLWLSHVAGVEQAKQHSVKKQTGNKFGHTRKGGLVLLQLGQHPTSLLVHDAAAPADPARGDTRFHSQQQLLALTRNSAPISGPPANASKSCRGHRDLKDVDVLGCLPHHMQNSEKHWRAFKLCVCNKQLG